MGVATAQAPIEERADVGAFGGDGSVAGSAARAVPDDAARASPPASAAVAPRNRRRVTAAALNARSVLRSSRMIDGLLSSVVIWWRGLGAICGRHLRRRS